MKMDSTQRLTIPLERVSRRGSISSENYDVSDTTPYQYDLSGTPVTMPNASILLDVAGNPPEFYRRDVILTVSITFKSEGILDGCWFAC